jgi:hypothetical protein
MMALLLIYRFAKAQPRETINQFGALLDLSQEFDRLKP